MMAGTLVDPGNYLDHLWIGATVVNQAEADRDVPKLLEIPAAKRFLSMEPLLGPISFEGMWVNHADVRVHENMLERIDWVILGGESGPHARAMHPDWARAIRDQCVALDVPFLFKQWGQWSPITRVDGFHESPFGYHVGTKLGFANVGKKKAGRLLDGCTHDGFPRAA